MRVDAQAIGESSWETKRCIYQPKSMGIGAGFLYTLSSEQSVQPPRIKASKNIDFPGKKTTEKVGIVGSGFQCLRSGKLDVYV